jgi:uncharacterized protein YjbI with pentapeptide repeats
VSSVTSSITTADIESLCERPGAFARFVQLLFAAHPEHRDAQWQTLSARLGAITLDLDTHTIAWLWPRAPDDDPGPWLNIDPVIHQWVGRTDLVPKLRVIVARMPRDPTRWAEQIAAPLRSASGRPKLRVDIDGPATLLRWLEEFGGSAEIDPLFRARRRLDARPYEYSPCERALMTALDLEQPADQHWLVVADELQRRGDPTGESLALALATRPDRPSQGRVLSRAYVDLEARRMATAARHTRMFAFADSHGRSFDATAFIPDGDELPEPDRYEVQLWAARVGPFFERLLVRTNHEAWAGVGLPDVCLDAPELRYLSPLRMSSIQPGWALVSGRDFSGFDFSALPRIGDFYPYEASVLAYEASLRGCNLCGADLSGWRLEGADLREAIADRHTRFGGANLCDARVSPSLYTQLQTWNSPSRRRRPGDPRGDAHIRGIRIVRS